MAKNRTGRVGEQIKKELSVLIQNEVKDPRVGFVTVTGVDVTSDLSQAKVYISIFGDEEKKAESLKGLDKALGYLRTELGKRMRLRHTPELIFKVDESIEYGSRIEKLLGEITQDEEK
ncbi:30S ribosome-binding factor RbfA [Paenibacillus fonticola]|uniref:30S ribosome-binding factor RbfA n=1 Tax=Paenibacillus fonticola TaxID=379896 RepID=UPI00037AF15F|nr:30S ribosome-binding factor RbfA [Paenibacillus fonticola]